MNGRDFGKPVDDAGDFGAKAQFDIVERHIGIFHHIVHQGASHRRWAKAKLMGSDMRHS